MWSAKARVAQIYLSSQWLSMRGRDGGFSATRVPDARAATDRLAHIMRSERGQRLRVALGGGICRAIVSERVSGVRDRIDHEAALTAYLRHTGRARDDEVGRVVSVVAPGEPALAVLVRAEVLERLEELARQGWKIESIKPWWAEFMPTFACLRGATRLLLAHDCESLTILEGGIDSVISGAATLEASGSDSLIEREIARRAIASPESHLIGISLTPSRPQAAERGSPDRGLPVWTRVHAPR